MVCQSTYLLWAMGLAGATWKNLHAIRRSTLTSLERAMTTSSWPVTSPLRTLPCLQDLWV